MWDIEEDETTTVDAAPAEGADGAAADGTTGPEVAEPPPPEATKGFEPKKLIFQHWVRPKFLQYTYLYDYQHNYYDEVIHYLDRRNRGLPVEKPRSQTWAERALRTYLSKSTNFTSRSTNKDLQLLKAVSTGARFHRYHSKSLISRKYSKLGFNTVSI